MISQAAVAVERAMRFVFKLARMMAREPLMLLLFVVLPMGLFLRFGNKLWCDPDHVKRTDIIDSDWTVIADQHKCTTLAGGVTTVFALNRKTNERQEIFQVVDIVVTNIKSEWPESVSITLSNFVNFIRQNREFNGFRVVYKFYPKEDIQAGEEYLFWLSRPYDDPRADEWLKKNVPSEQTIHEVVGE